MYLAKYWIDLNTPEERPVHSAPFQAVSQQRWMAWDEVYKIMKDGEAVPTAKE